MRIDQYPSFRWQWGNVYQYNLTISVIRVLGSHFILKTTSTPELKSWTKSDSEAEVTIRKWLPLWLSEIFMQMSFVVQCIFKQKIPKLIERGTKLIETVQELFHAHFIFFSELDPYWLSLAIMKCSSCRRQRKTERFTVRDEFYS